MNIRKNIDYSEMYKGIDQAIAADLSQIEEAAQESESTNISEKLSSAKLSVSKNHYPGSRFLGCGLV